MQNTTTIVHYQPVFSKACGLFTSKNKIKTTLRNNVSAHWEYFKFLHTLWRTTVLALCAVRFLFLPKTVLTKRWKNRIMRIPWIISVEATSARKVIVVTQEKSLFSLTVHDLSRRGNRAIDKKTRPIWSINK